MENNTIGKLFLFMHHSPPTPLNPSDYMKYIVNEDFSFPDKEIAEKFFRYLFSLKNSVIYKISRPFEKAEDFYKPCCLKIDENDKADGVIFANGFMCAFSSFPEIHAPFMENKRTKNIADPFIIVAGQDHPDEDLREDTIPEEKYEEFICLMLMQVNLIYKFLKEEENSSGIPSDSPLHPINNNIH